jgi:hypothetical protein
MKFGFSSSLFQRHGSSMGFCGHSLSSDRSLILEPNTLQTRSKKQ